MKAYRGRLNAGNEQIDIVDVGPGGMIAASMALNPRYDLRNHSPDGLSWGYHGSGPAQAALAILCDALHDDARALQLYQSFKSRVLAALPMDEEWQMTHDQVLQRVRQLESERRRPILSAAEEDAK